MLKRLFWLLRSTSLPGHPSDCFSPSASPWDLLQSALIGHIRPSLSSPLFLCTSMYLFNSFDFISSCISSSCLNGGTCEETIIGHKCRCLPPFHGPFCQYDSMQLGWTIFEIFMLFGFITLILVAMAIICCSYNRNMGVYVSVPTVKNYDRWSGTGEVSDEEEDVIALGDLRKGIRTSQTKETILEAEAGCSNSFNQPML